MAVMKSGKVQTRSATPAARLRAAGDVASNNSAQGEALFPEVNRVSRGGFIVYGTPTKPKHLTPEQIAEAVAALGR
jgi:hypothetical protein